MPEKKSLIEVALMPLVVALVGIVGTWFITNQQQENAKVMSDVQLSITKDLADADREVKMLEIFAEKITSPEPAERILALRLLRAIDADLAQKLAVAVSQGESEQSEVRKVAEEVAEEAAARAGLLPRIYFHIQGSESRQPARSVREKLTEQGYVVPGIERIGRGPTSSQLRYFRKAEEDEAKEIVRLLGSLGVTVELQYVQGHEESKAIRPQHYELWFARGEPRPAAS